ncbi:glycosyltransferase [Glutamicibacter sp.]|uniref:glycosyltransferase n=1 Tax=Glutamicibacter sp. TaxID=1931995 RepID=UPI002B498B75|nr:glycosyltransferase [Glutamicibacter sp.]HJX76998.1 glycosyltransferase [Glutamicibacter sp.]
MSSTSLRAVARSLRFTVDRLRAISTYKNLFNGNVENLTFSKPALDMPHVLFITSNGAGMGHITRCLAVAKSGSEDFHASFVTLSTSAEVIAQQGFEYLHFASAGTTGQPARLWNNNFYQFFNVLTRRNHFDAVVFDGTWIYRGLRDVLDKKPSLKLIWLRRGLWKKTASIEQLPEMEAYCARILTPWDVGDRLDDGPLSHRKTQTLVQGIVLSNSALLSRKSALEELALDPDGNYALVQLGAGNINDISDIRQKVTAAIQEQSRGAVMPVIASSPLSNHVQGDENSITVRKYPISPYLRAFDFVVSAAGYNSIHEIIKWDVPSLVIPNLNASTDDQKTRADALCDDVKHFTALSDSEIYTYIAALLDRSSRGCDSTTQTDGYPQFIDSGEEAAQAISETIRL